jgi:hypothetical protein
MSAMTLDLPFQPIRSNLYSSRELMDAYDPNDPTSMGRTLDFKSYRYFTVASRCAVSHGASWTRWRRFRRLVHGG